MLRVLGGQSAVHQCQRRPIVGQVIDRIGQAFYSRIA